MSTISAIDKRSDLRVRRCAGRWLFRTMIPPQAIRCPYQRRYHRSPATAIPHFGNRMKLVSLLYPVFVLATDRSPDSANSERVEPSEEAARPVLAPAITSATHNGARGPGPALVAA